MAGGSRGAWLARTVLAGVVSAGGLLGPPAARAEETCVQCHRQQRDPRLQDPVKEMPESVHGEYRLTCTTCHGGNPEATNARAHDPSTGFRARHAAEGPSLCGDCHASREQMDRLRATRAEPGRASAPAGPAATPAAARPPRGRPDLPTDQLALYLESAHGRAFDRGNERAATCAACHGAHSVRRVADAASSVSPAHVAETCGRCHSDEDLARAVGLPADQERQWRRSVHGQEHARWLARTEGAATRSTEERHPPACNDCHEDHGMVSRELAAVQGCRACHEDEWQAYVEGPHAEAFRERGFLPCADCHGSHEVLRADATQIGVEPTASCRRCHAEGQEMFETIRTLARAVRAAETAADGVLEPDAARAHEVPAARLEAVRAARHSLRLAVHTLDADRISAAATALTARAGEVPPPSVLDAVVAGARSWGPAAGLAALGLACIAFVFARRREAAKE